MRIRFGIGFTSTFIVCLLVLSACAGSQFTRATSDTVALGKTTRSSLEAQMGKPAKETDLVINDKEFDQLIYAYASAGMKPLFEGVTPAHSQIFLIHKGVVVGHDFTSSAIDDATYFKSADAKKIKKGMSLNQIKSILGTPDCYAMPPLLSAGEVLGVAYLYVETTGFDTRRRTLSIGLNESNIAVRVEYNSNVERP